MTSGRDEQKYGEPEVNSNPGNRRKTNMRHGLQRKRQGERRRAGYGRQESKRKLIGTARTPNAKIRTAIFRLTPRVKEIVRTVRDLEPNPVYSPQRTSHQRKISNCSQSLGVRGG